MSNAVSPTSEKSPASSGGGTSGFYLDHVQSERAGSVDHFEQDVVTVGRAEECTLIFEEMGVSWAHAEIRLRDGAYWVIDRGSTNGTYVNDERAHNARLNDGDVLKFGKKKAPVLRFRLGKPSKQAAKPVRDPKGESKAERKITAGEIVVPTDLVAEVDKADKAKAKAEKVKARPKPGAGLPAVVVKPAAERDKPQDDAARLNARIDPGDAHSDLPPAAPIPLDTGAGWQYALIICLAILCCSSLGVVAVLWLDTVEQEAELRNERDRVARLQRDKKALEDDQAKAIREARKDAREGERRLAEADLGRAQREAERIKAVADEQVTDLQAQVRRLESELARAEAELRVLRSDVGGTDWKEIEGRLSQSVVLIATRLEALDPDGNRVPLHSFGTGFFISQSGHIATNKHVVQPWKYRPLAERMASEGLSIVEDSYQIHVWPAGSQFLHRVGGHTELDVSTGYSTSNGTLSLLRTADDRWTQMSLSGGVGARNIRIHEEFGNEDIALLQAPSARQNPIPCGRSDGVEKLDEVMVLGFPAGPTILEAGVAETSPARGQVRKVEQTIFVSAAMLGGNSGGPLVDRNGRVVGISTRVVSGTETLGSCLRIEHAVQLLQGGSW
jgi:predicted component of type VI protein secretion system